MYGRGRAKSAGPGQGGKQGRDTRQQGDIGMDVVGETRVSMYVDFCVKKRWF